ncbi:MULTISPECIES: hypothetical protein [Sphingomonas]|uniref:hypothetical protein n=1 Tax=Sphingomonas TaxID=13687 RepID=UPI000DEFC1DD|nr:MULTISPECIES: hypothetical protein [Sphingomonas]
MGWFTPKAVVDADELDWLLATLRWIDEEDPALGSAGDRPLFLPTAEYYPAMSSRGHALAAEIFALVQRQCGMADWPCELVALPDSRASRVEAIGVMETSNGALGTYQQLRGRNDPRISYRPELLDDPALLVATFAHELAHYRMHSFATLPPGGAELEELATDLLAVRMGFGVLLANVAKNFSAYTAHDRQGWQSQRTGYLSERARVTALAINERLVGRDPMASAGSHLKSYLRSDLRKADRHLRHAFPDLPAAMAAIDLTAFA